MFIVFDTETNGKIQGNAAPEQVDLYPRISQLAYNVYDDKRELIKRVSNYVLPDGWGFPDEEFFRKHADINVNITQGKPISVVLDEFIADRSAAQFVIAHNINFDVRIVRSEMIRANKKMEFTAKKICTMMKSTSYAKVPNKNGRAGYKWPTLTELHYALFKSDFEGAHGADFDVEACAKCFFELVNRKVITLD